MAKGSEKEEEVAREEKKNINVIQTCILYYYKWRALQWRWLVMANSFFFWLVLVIRCFFTFCCFV